MNDDNADEEVVADEDGGGGGAVVAGRLAVLGVEPPEDAAADPDVAEVVGATADVVAEGAVEEVDCRVEELPATLPPLLSTEGTCVITRLTLFSCSVNLSMMLELSSSLAKCLRPSDILPTLL